MKELFGVAIITALVAVGCTEGYYEHKANKIIADSNIVYKAKYDSVVANCKCFAQTEFDEYSEQEAKRMLRCQ